MRPHLSRSHPAQSGCPACAARAAQPLLLQELVEEGKVRYIGVSESSAADIRAGHAVHPLSAVQLEWSLWSRDAEVMAAAPSSPTC